MDGKDIIKIFIFWLACNFISFNCFCHNVCIVWFNIWLFSSIGEGSSCSVSSGAGGGFSGSFLESIITQLAIPGNDVTEQWHWKWNERNSDLHFWHWEPTWQNVDSTPTNISSMYMINLTPNSTNKTAISFRSPGKHWVALYCNYSHIWNVILHCTFHIFI